MWYFYALLGPPFWALVHILDRHCVGNVFDRPWMGVITSSLATAVILLPGMFILAFFDWHTPDLAMIALALLAGGLIQIGQGFYFQALENTEAGVVAAYGNFTPTLLPLFSYFVTGDLLQPWHYFTIAVLVVASICFCLIDISQKGNGGAILWMLLACTVQVFAILIEKYLFEHSTFLISFMLIVLGIVLSGVLPLLAIPLVRRAFRQNLPKLSPLAPLFLGIEVVNVLALYLSQRAIDLGSPVLVSAMETTVPGFTFLLTIMLVAFKHRFGDEKAKYKLRSKLFLVVVMTISVMRMV